MEHFSISANVKSFPQQQYEEMKDTILGKKYTLSLAFVSSQKAQKLNQTYRKKNYIPNVLSFPLTRDHGEIYIVLSVAKKEAHKFNMSYEGYVGFLFVHALLHLNGLQHGDTMEKAEKRYCRKYNLH